jgi:exopolyphosphatase / guanosine-5'-triphosphate,3'-diphosphate pyrophosphatase
MEQESWPRGGAVPRNEAHGHAAPRSEQRRAPHDTAYAALDLGTNNCRLLIARPTDSSFRIVDSFSRIIRLGEGIAQTGRISEPAIDRALAALRICRDKIVSKRAGRTRLIATEACRAASNRDEFRERVDRELGIRLEVIDRETEAMLAVTGCLPLLDPQAAGVVLFDIGGGSSELVRLECDPARPELPPRIAGWVSLPVGVVTLAERRGGVNVTPQSYAAMVDEVAAMLAPFAETHGGNLGGVHLLGTSGTVTTVAGIYLNLPRYDRRQVDGIWMHDADVTRTVQRPVAGARSLRRRSVWPTARAGWWRSISWRWVKFPA